MLKVILYTSSYKLCKFLLNWFILFQTRSTKQVRESYHDVFEECVPLKCELSKSTPIKIFLKDFTSFFFKLNHSKTKSICSFHIKYRIFSIIKIVVRNIESIFYVVFLNVIVKVTWYMQKRKSVLHRCHHCHGDD